MRQASTLTQSAAAMRSSAAAEARPGWPTTLRPADGAVAAAKDISVGGGEGGGEGGGGGDGGEGGAEAGGVCGALEREEQEALIRLARKEFLQARRTLAAGDAAERPLAM